MAAQERRLRRRILDVTARRSTQLALAVVPALLLLFGTCLAHTVAEGDQAFVRSSTGAQIVPFIYLGAKHMVTGYDHLLFLAGVIFFLYRLEEVALYVTLFAIGHSSTLLAGVLAGLHVNPFLVDAIIGLSVVYKALDNLDAFRTWFGWQPNAKAAVLLFGFFHGFGLATKLQELELARDGLVPNMIAFNVGVEIGQLLALSAILLAMNYWRRTASFTRHAYAANVALLTAGFILTGFQLTGYAIGA
ncbi:MAG: HupE/UreJ family protein [Steroidobacteraceae bacterium]